MKARLVSSPVLCTDSHMPHSLAEVGAILHSDCQCCILHKIARHKVPMQVGAESLNQSDYDMRLTFWLSWVCV